MVSNPIVLGHLQCNPKLTLNVYNLVWNATVDATLYSSRQKLLEVALILTEILQDPILNHSTLVDLSYMYLRNGKLDLALQYAKEAEASGGSEHSRLVLLEIMMENSDLEIESTRAFVNSTFDLSIISLNRSIYLVCLSLERQNYLMAGILLDSALSTCLNEDEACDIPDLVPIIFQNLFALTLETNHPYLMSNMVHWMDKCNANLVDISAGGLFTKVRSFLYMWQYT